MSAPLRLVIFDVDGTLVDSQGGIVAAMQTAFDAVGQPMPERSEVLRIVGLSLSEAMAKLAPELSPGAHSEMVAAYKHNYMTHSTTRGAALSSPLFPGALDVLHRLNAQPETLLGIATGNSRRGLDRLIKAHGLEGLFITQQVADFHPSKPDPSMVLQAMRETGVEPHQTVMIGDTSFDMEMAQSAGVAGIGVSWGYHPAERLSAARMVLDDIAALPRQLETIWEGAS